MKKFNELSNPQYLDDYLNYMETIKGMSKLTIQEYYYDLRTFLKYVKCTKILGEFPNNFDDDKFQIIDVDISYVDKICLSDLYSYLSWLTREKNNSAGARARKVASLRSFFKFLYDKTGLISTNPTSDLESPKIKKRLPKYLNVDESVQLLDAVDGEFFERDYAILTLFLNCGMRLSELVSINISCIRDDKLTIIGKGDKERVIYLNQACVDAIAAYLRVRQTEGVVDKNALFLSKRKKRIAKTTVQHIVKKYLQMAGLDAEKYSTHKLRHTAATLMYKHGNVDIRSLQEILGHESISTTEIYTHLDDAQLKEAVDANPLAQLKVPKKDQ